ncbi:hypothetical protein DFJ77DRAFT_474455 [Powellomyces hirtus]|nr:hypothetical protein DFJ77DRAFT_474455 [Powellomyces hirtus]
MTNPDPLPSSPPPPQPPSASRADTHLLSLFSHIDTYIQHQSLLANHTSDGSLALAAAKYALGPTSISQIQYDARMQATRTINILQVEDRQRESGGEGGERLEWVFEEQQEKVKKGNPIAWFAPLPPTSLRAAQTSFTQLVHVAVRLANIVREIEHARIQCSEDKKDKMLHTPGPAEEGGNLQQ